MFQLLIDPIDVCSLSLPRIYWLSEKKILYQKEMSIFSLFCFERNEHNHMKVKLNTKIKKNRDQSKTHIARCSCNPLNLCSACIPMQVMHAIHVMLAHQVAPVCDETKNLNETESETFFRYQIFPKPILFSIPNFFDTETVFFFDTKFF